MYKQKLKQNRWDYIDLKQNCLITT